MTIRTTATKTFKLTSEEEATEESAGPRCPEAAAPVSSGGGPATLSAEGWEPAGVGAAPEAESSSEIEWVRGSRLVLTR